MNVEFTILAKENFSEFMEKHDLTLQIEQTYSDRWIARIKDVEIKHNGILTSVYGWGNSAINATEDLTCQVSLKLLVYKATQRKNRREIRAPKLICDNKTVMALSHN